MSYSNEDIDRAVSAAMRKPTFEDKLREAAEMFLALEDLRPVSPLQRSLARTDSGKFKRTAVRILLEAALSSTKNKTKAAEKVGVHRKSFDRIIHSDHSL